MRFLLGVNLPIALVDTAHVQHDNAHDWFGRVGCKAFATCPITENGLLRIVGHPNHNGQLATLDHKLATEVVPSGQASLALI